MKTILLLLGLTFCLPNIVKGQENVQNNYNNLILGKWRTDKRISIHSKEEKDFFGNSFMSPTTALYTFKKNNEYTIEYDIKSYNSKGTWEIKNDDLILTERLENNYGKPRAESIKILDQNTLKVANDDGYYYIYKRE